MAILELTKQNLQELNFEKEHIKKLLTWNEYGMHLSNEVFACIVNRKIYTEKDYYTRTYNENSKPIFPFRILELIPDYYDACLKQFLNAKQKLLGKIFNELLEKNEFIKSQINESEEIINYYSDRYKNSLEKFEKFPTVVGRKAYKVWLENLPPQQNETEKEKENSRTFTANEYALAYIFDLDASGKSIPINPTEGGYNKKKLIKIGYDLYKLDNKKDTFYRAVKKIANNYDRNKQIDLKNISQNWIEAVRMLSRHWDKTQKYLIEKKLIGD
ncbi:MAG: hypothetical protein IM592_16975 [Bacteroidetes bacterium]|nr:hypothetical protein [Bacteroidota bacterium]